MAQSDARFGYSAKLNREGHRLTQPFGFTAAPGMLLPIFADIATPGDSYYINHDLSFLRTAPLAAPAMVDVKVHYETFFVPMQMIYQPFENAEFSLKNLQSSNYNSANLQNQTFPTFDYYYYLCRVCSSNPTGSGRSLNFRLADMLDLQALNFCQDTTTIDANTGYFVTEDRLQYKYHPSFFPWQILAYNTIFQYYFRLDDKTQFDNSFCNWDQYYSSTSPVQLITNRFMTIHQRPWDFDYFTSVYRSPIVSDSNMQSVLASGIYSDLISDSTTRLSGAGNIPSNNDSIRAFTAGAGSSYSAADVRMSTSTALIRQAFANEKLAMITGRSRKDYDSQVLAHYGVKVPHDVKHDLTLIGRDTYLLHVGEVTSLAGTSDNALGDLAGKGYASGKGHDIKFTAPCHGVVMTIFSIEPVKRYYGGFNRINAVSNAFDLPIPEYDRLGNVPMYQFELGSRYQDTGGSYVSWSQIAGWKERYYQWKRRKPRVSIGFWNPAISGTGNLNGVNDYEPFFISSFALGYHKSLSYPLSENPYYIEVECMDGLMLVPMRLSWGDGGTELSPDEDWNNNPHLCYAHDPFVVDSDLKVKKVSWMSKDGEPVYPY